MFIKRTAKITIIITFLLILSVSLIAYYELFLAKKVTTQEIITIKEIDNRISPLETQGLILEIIRIRHRGLLEKLIKPGKSWKQKPSFFFISDMDGFEYSSKDVQIVGKSSEYLFNTWDTMFQENKILKNVEEEQLKSNVTLRIFEREKKGLLGIRSKDIEREKIQVTYDYRTGRWSGDDNFKDYDGYGHYVGEYFEVWFNLYQSDYDEDGIPYWTEVNIIHSNPKVDDSTQDPDEDGIPTAWEWRWGYDPNAWDDHVNLDPDIDGIENIEEYITEQWLADPYSQDIYVEVDGTKRGGLFDLIPHIFWEESQQANIERFRQHNINLYIDYGWPDTPPNGGGEQLPYHKMLSQDSGMMLQFYEHNFPDERKGIFRYVVIGNSGGFCHPSKYTAYDSMHIYTNTKSFLNPFTSPIMIPTPRTFRVHLGVEFMHEMGHSLGIAPWTFEGCDNLSWVSRQDLKKYRETWVQYYSVMNYYWTVNYDPRKKLLDYSDGSNGPPYDQNDWEHLFLPTFQIESTVVEDPTVSPPCGDLATYELNAIEKLEFGFDDWEYDENLTNKFIGNISNSLPMKHKMIDWRVYINKEDSKSSTSNRNVRVYALPLVFPTDAEYLLVKEGHVDLENNLQFYTIQDLIENAMNHTSL